MHPNATSSVMNRDLITSRWAGALYLVVVVTGLFSLMYVPAQINVAGDAQATVNKLMAHSTLYRAGIAAFFVKQVAFLLLPLVFFELFRPVHLKAAVLMLTFAVISVPMALVSVAHKLDALDILGGAYSQAFTPEQLQWQVMLTLDAYGNGLLATTLFWGLWLLPLGFLVIRSGFLPKILGVFLVLGGLAYVVQVFWQILLPQLAFPGSVMVSAAIGEIGTCLWLLIVGVRPARPRSV